MSGPLDAEARALWKRVTDTVRALKGVETPSPPDPRFDVSVRVEMVARPVDKARERPCPARTGSPPLAAGDTLDGGWDRRLRRGMVTPDRAIDLHGHTLATAHAALERALEDAVASGGRVLLVVTGKPPRPHADGRPRGAIRASIGDWLGGSRHAGRIAAVRAAHPRHGGAGAIYVILRRAR